MEEDIELQPTVKDKFDLAVTAIGKTIGMSLIILIALAVTIAAVSAFVKFCQLMYDWVA